MKYEYPPSKHIRAFAPLDDTSHVHASGRVEFDDIEVPCTFEAVYTHNCEVVVAIYLDSSAYREVFFKKTQQEGSVTYSIGGKPLRNTHFRRLTGVDSYLQREVSIEDGYLRSLGGTESPTIFIANKMLIIDTRESTLENQERHHAHLFYLTGIDFDTAFVHQQVFPIGDNPQQLTLERIYRHERRFDNDTLVRLIVPNVVLPNGWSPYQIADLWCALVSLAIGRDVRWTCVENANDERIAILWKHRTNVLGLNRFQGLISLVFFESESAQVIEFIKRCFAAVQKGKITPVFAETITPIIRNYVSYRLIQQRSVDTARLVTTSVEELLFYWEKTRGLLPPIIDEDEKLAILTGIDTDALTTLIKTAITSPTKLEPKLGERRRDVHARIRRYLKKELAFPMAEDKIRILFRESSITDEWFDSHVQRRLDPFRVTRNAVVHNGSFPDENPRVNTWYFYNALMIFPLIIFALFGYDGFYIDLMEYWKDAIEPPQLSEKES